MSDDVRVKRKKLGTPKASPKAGEADTPGTPSFASRIPKTVPLAGLFSSRIYSLESAKGFLKDHGVLDNNQVIDIPVICAALSVLSDSPHRSISTLTDRMKSVCFLLKEMDSTTLMIDNGDKDEPVIRELTEQRAMLARLESTIVVMAAHSQGEMRDLKRGLEETKNNVVVTVKSEAAFKDAARLSPKELVTKGDLALDLMAKGGIAVPKGAAFVSASTTRRGAVIYQINSKGAADWLKSGNNLESFASHMGSVDAAHAWLFYVFMKFVPVSFMPDNQEDGHSTADRDCPAFEQNLAKFHRFTPDARYRFYPIADDTHTWEPCAPDIAPPPSCSWGRTPYSSTGASVWAPPNNDGNHMQEDMAGEEEDGRRTPRPLSMSKPGVSWDEQMGSPPTHRAIVSAGAKLTSTPPPPL
ncbi:hypothetical protein AX14_002202 [Amanita brunnescens Koide BX004]|nr:hypothetical protein AX14_002202 [Amanita brunnescens Koide BX004]